MINPWVVQIIIAIVSIYISYTITASMLDKNRSGSEPGQYEKPTASAGKTMYVVFGTRLIKDPNVIWFGQTGTSLVEVD